MKSPMLALAVVLLGGAAFAQAADLTMTVSADRPVPWTSATPVVVTMTITNQANEPRRAVWIDIEGIDQRDGLIHHVDILTPESVEEMGGHPSCVDFSPVMHDLIWCLPSKPIAPGQTLTIRFAIVAFPNASGFRQARWTAQTETGNFGAVPDSARVLSVDQLIAYGYLPRVAIPGIGNVAVAMLVFALLFAASWRMNANTRLRGNRS